MRLLYSLLFVFSSLAQSQETAESLFKDFQEALFQIQIIENESSNKSAIGSGFAVDKNHFSSQQDGLVITNYHVISKFIYDPDKYRIEFQDSQGRNGKFELVDFDVVNDLAVLRLPDDRINTTKLNLATEMPIQGSAIYSLGNPRDLGMSVVPGTYNGIKKTSFYKRVHVTGAINPGMSGGPAINVNGEVIGVNVATGGNQIGFLVPLIQLNGLLSRAGNKNILSSDYKRHIQAQLVQNQADFMQEFTTKTWPQAKLGKALIPGKVTDFVSCWGDSNAKKEDAKFLSIQNRCRTGESIFVNGNLRTGTLEMEFEWVSTDQLESHKFYNMLSKSTAGARPGNRAREDDVTNFACHYDKVKGAGTVTNKAVICIRAYKDFNELYDALYIATSLDHRDQSLISHFTLAGVTQNSIEAFSEQFMESIAWQ